MGIARLLLAITVLLGHGGSHVAHFVGAINAVQMFYVISGFLISYILIGNISYRNSVSSFYLNRYLRLFPIYFITASMALLWKVSRSDVFVTQFLELPLVAKFLLVIWNTSLLGIDWYLFSGVIDGNFTFLMDFRRASPQLVSFLLVPQAWSLGVELCFYLVAPFLVFRRNWMMFLCLTGLLARYWAIEAGFGTQDPWRYRFFPFELSLFLLGALSHQLIYERFKDSLTKMHSRYAFIVFLSIFTLYSIIPFHAYYKSVAIIAVFVLLLPWLFSFQNTHKIDKLLGEYSYPVYIVHLLTNSVCYAVFQKYSIATAGYVWLSTIIGTALICSHAVMKVTAPIEKYRARIRTSN